MKLAVVGSENRNTKAVISHGKKHGFRIVSPHRLKKDTLNINFDASEAVLASAVKKADAVLCVLHEGYQILDESSRNLIKRLVNAMLAGGTRRIVLFSRMPKDHADRLGKKRTTLVKRVKSFFMREARQAETALDLLKSSGLDWTIVGWPSDKQSAPKGLGKHMINQVTDTASLRQVFMLPGSHSDQALD